MREAASLLLGEHDFRNFCKIDGGKQISNYKRTVISADINTLPSSDETGRFVFDLKGSAFLYHQVRHIMAILFLVGSGVEKPNIVSQLLDVDLTPTKPAYEMANEIPLVLFSCRYWERSLNWYRGQSDIASRMSELNEDAFIRQQVKELHLAAATAIQSAEQSIQPSQQAAMIQLGAGTVLKTAANKVIPLMKRPRGLHYDVINAKWKAEKDRKRAIASEANEGIK